METLGQYIKNLRGKMSLRDAANNIGISHTYLDTIEKGFDKRSKKPVKPTPETLKLISEAYLCSYEDLMVKAGYIEPSKSSENTLSKDDEQAAFEKFINDPNLQVFYKELPNSEEEEIEMLREFWEIIKKNKKK